MRSAFLWSSLGAIVVLVAASTPARAASESAHSLYERGLSLYGDGNYEGAVDAFSEVLAAGVDDAAVHYNLANSYFKSGRLGFAIYHYRRAHALAPRDHDIAANLEYARFLALDSVEEEGARTDLRVEGWLDRITSEEVFRISVALWILAAAAAIFWQILAQGGLFWRRSVMVLAILWAISFAGAWAVDHRASRSNEAVVLPREAEVRSGPGDAFGTAFVLHEGAEVVVEGERGSWTEISLPGELRGWISSDWIARL
jgi:tetratricopeptide (TPR) repeat protein